MATAPVENKGHGEGASLPPPEVYEREYDYWPWGELLQRVAQWIVYRVPRRSLVVDYMCGTGYLLNTVSAQRPELALFGCDFSPTFVDYANRSYPKLSIILEDALSYRPPRPADVIICTAGLHHLTRVMQPLFIDKVASDLAERGHFLLGEEFIREHGDEQSRALAALEMGSALIEFNIRSGAPRGVVGAALSVLHNDLFQDGEFKRSRSEVLLMLSPLFDIKSIEQIWPKTTDAFGDCLLICRRKY